MPNNLMGRELRQYGNDVCSEQDPLSLKRLQNINGDILVFHRDWSQECYHGNNIVGIIFFLLQCTFLVPSVNTAPKFLEIFLIHYLIV